MQPGQRLGPYEILQQLGAGGMGEVYMAQDTRLGRKVAVKVLPPQFASDPERLARFEQEARAAAALNHPHIAAVFDIGRAADDEGLDTHFIVQELLDGHDLHALLQSGPLPRDRALQLAAEVAEAMAAAHAAGIVHRDLKPQNVFVSPAGHAKVLDFGLAKLVETPGTTGRPTSGLTQSPTMLGTMAGAVLGSAGYMAPEQAAGNATDHRADLFACGCLLYEMLVGQRAFDGDTLVETLHAVIRDEPRAMSATDERLDADIRWLLEKCLAKDPARRYQSAADLAVDLRRLEKGGVPPARADAAGPVADRRRWPWVAAIVAAVLLGGFAGASWSPRGDAPAGLRMAINVEFPSGIEPSYFAVSPDGSTLAYRDGSTEEKILLRRLDSFEARPVLGSDGGIGPRFSPDGQRLSFFAGGRLLVVDVAGGSPRVLCEVSQTNSSSVWAGDGFIYFAQWATDTGIWRVEETGGVAEAIFGVDETRGLRRPRLLPDGRGLVVNVGAGPTGATNVYFFDGSPFVRIDRREVTYLDTGIALFLEAGELFAATYDPSSYQIQGSPVPLETGVIQYELSASGVLVFRYSALDAESIGTGELRRLSRYSRTGPLGVGEALSTSAARPAVSPDQTMILTSDELSGGLSLWDVARGTRRTIWDTGTAPVWGPDGNTVYFVTGASGVIERITLDGSEPPASLYAAPGAAWVSDISPDGKLLAFYEIHPETQRDIWMLPLDGGEPYPFLVTPASERSATFSPDGRWIAYMSDIGGRDEVYVRAADGSGGEVLVTVDGGREPRWSPDGQELYFRYDNGLYAVPVSSTPRFSVGRPELLFTGTFLFEEGGRNQQYDVFDNGDFLMTETASQANELRVVTDWLGSVQDRLQR